MIKNRVAIIGCGNIGLSIIQGLLKAKTIPAKNITATRRNIHELDHLKESGIRLTIDNINAVNEADLIVIAVKPYNIASVLEEIKDHLNPGKHILISVTAGIPIRQIQDVIGIQVPVFRAMPNISASVGKSVSCVSHNGAKTNEIDSLKYLFDII